MMKGLSAAAAALILLSGCAIRSGDEYVFAIEQALATSPRGADFARVVPGDWDRLCVFRPFTRVAIVDSVIGAPWSGARRTNIETRDTATLLTFTRQTEVIDHVLYPLHKGEFGTPGPEQWYCLPRDRAVFEQRVPIHGGAPWIGPVGGWEGGP